MTFSPDSSRCWGSGSHAVAFPPHPLTAAGRFGDRKGASGTNAGALLVVLGFMGWDPMIEICEFWNALWHDAWTTWDGLWLFQARKRPIDRALGEARFVEVVGLG